MTASYLKHVPREELPDLENQEGEGGGERRKKEEEEEEERKRERKGSPWLSDSISWRPGWSSCRTCTSAQHRVSGISVGSLGQSGYLACMGDGTRVEGLRFSVVISTERKSWLGPSGLKSEVCRNGWNTSRQWAKMFASFLCLLVFCTENLTSSMETVWLCWEGWSPALSPSQFSGCPASGEIYWRKCSFSVPLPVKVHHVRCS